MIAWPEVLYGTGVMSILARFLRSSIMRCMSLPKP